MKKLIVCSLAFALAISMAACGSDKPAEVEESEELEVAEPVDPATTPAEDDDKDVEDEQSDEDPVDEQESTDDVDVDEAMQAALDAAASLAEEAGIDLDDADTQAALEAAAQAAQSILEAAE